MTDWSWSGLHQKSPQKPHDVPYLSAYVCQPVFSLLEADQRALDVALALATGPRVLLLDEPTAGMSPFETERMVERIQRLAQEFNLTVLFSEHDMNVVFGISDRITVLHRGQVIAEGNALDIQSNAEVTAVYLGSDA